MVRSRVLRRSLLVAVLVSLATGACATSAEPGSTVGASPSDGGTVASPTVATQTEPPAPSASPSLPTASPTAAPVSICDLGLDPAAMPEATARDPRLESIADLRVAADTQSDPSMQEILRAEVAALEELGFLERCRRQFDVEGARRPSHSRVLRFTDASGAGGYLATLDPGCARRDLDLGDESLLIACSLADMVIGVAARRDGPIVREVSVTVVLTDPFADRSVQLDQVSRAAALLATLPPLDAP